MLLDPGSLDLLPRAADALARLGGDRRFKLELPASQLEITLPPVMVPEAARLLRGARDDLTRAVDGLALPVAVAVHPFAPTEGELNRSERYERALRDYGIVARRQLVCALQVHVAVGGAQRSLAVYNALRSHLPELAALAAAAPLRPARTPAWPRCARSSRASFRVRASLPCWRAGRASPTTCAGARPAEGSRRPARGGGSFAPIRPSERSRCGFPIHRRRSRRRRPWRR